MSKILLIDDEPTLRLTFRHALCEAGYNVTIASDGLEGYALHEIVRADLIITDLMMPYQDGFSMIKKLRKLDPDVPIIGMSGAPQRRVDELCIESGANIFLPKPVTIPQILKAVRELLPTD
jgi:CheY-like chemotaxis protein